MEISLPVPRGGRGKEWQWEEGRSGGIKRKAEAEEEKASRKRPTFSQKQTQGAKKDWHTRWTGICGDSRSTLGEQQVNCTDDYVRLTDTVYLAGMRYMRRPIGGRDGTQGEWGDREALSAHWCVWSLGPRKGARMLTPGGWKVGRDWRKRNEGPFRWLYTLLVLLQDLLACSDKSLTNVSSMPLLALARPGLPHWHS